MAQKTYQKFNVSVRMCGRQKTIPQISNINVLIFYLNRTLIFEICGLFFFFTDPYTKFECSIGFLRATKSVIYLTNAEGFVTDL